MRITKQYTNLEIDEIGLKIEIKTDLLLNSLISKETKISLEYMLKNRLSDLKVHFDEIHNNITSGKTDISTYKLTKNIYIKEYSCLVKDLGSLFGDVFEDFVEENEDMMDTIYSIFKYSELYGYKQLNEVTI